MKFYIFLQGENFPFTGAHGAITAFQGFLEKILQNENTKIKLKNGATAKNILGGDRNGI